MTRYWFARSSDRRYPVAMVPVTWHGKALMVVVIIGALIAWFGFAAAGMIYHTSVAERLPIFIGGLTPAALYLLLAFWLKGDRKHTDADYKKGLVALDTGELK